MSAANPNKVASTPTAAIQSGFSLARWREGRGEGSSLRPIGTRKQGGFETRPYANRPRFSVDGVSVGIIVTATLGGVAAVFEG